MSRVGIKGYSWLGVSPKGALEFLCFLNAVIPVLPECGAVFLLPLPLLSKAGRVAGSEASIGGDWWNIDRRSPPFCCHRPAAAEVIVSTVQQNRQGLRFGQPAHSGSGHGNYTAMHDHEARRRCHFIIQQGFSRPCSLRPPAPRCTKFIHTKESNESCKDTPAGWTTE